MRAVIEQLLADPEKFRSWVKSKGGVIGYAAQKCRCPISTFIKEQVLDRTDRPGHFLPVVLTDGQVIIRDYNQLIIGKDNTEARNVVELQAPAWVQQFVAEVDQKAHCAAIWKDEGLVILLRIIGHE